MNVDKSDLPSEKNMMQGLLHIMDVLGRYRWLIISISAVVMILGVAFAVVSIRLPPEKSPLPNLFTAEATILVNNSNRSDIAKSILDAMGIDQQSQAQSAYDNGDLILEILQSRTLLDRLIEEFGLTERYKVTWSVKGNTRKMLLNKSFFSYARNTGSFKIAYTDYDPVMAMKVVNRMVALLDEWFNLNRGLEKQKQRRLLADKIAEVKSEISSLESRLKDLQEQYGVLNVEELGQSQAASLASLRAQLILKEVEIKNYSGFARIKDPRLEQLREERQNLLDLITQSQDELPGIKSASSARIAISGKSKLSLPDVAQEFSRLKLELDIQQRIYNTLSPQYETAKLAPESDTVFQILEMAEVPDMKSGPERTRILLYAFMGSLALGIVLSLGLNSLKTMKASALENFYRGKH
jgi:tyrosine-protein kinase Etk/Wzc